MLSNLNEVNLKNNLILAVENLAKLGKLEKLYLGNNRLDIKNFEASDLVRVTSLKELSLENNPVSKDRVGYLRNVLKYLPGVKLLDGKAPRLGSVEA